MVPVAPTAESDFDLMTKPKAVGKRRALLVAAHYDSSSGSGFRSLLGTENDAKLMHLLLSETAAIKFDEIVSLSSSNPSSNEYASLANIKQNWKRLAKATKPEDVFLFYFSGHGSEIEDEKKPLMLSQVIVPSDAKTVDPKSCITDTYVEEKILKGIFAKNGAKNVTFVFDSCHSGDMTRDSEEMPFELNKNAVIKEIPSSAMKKRAKSVKRPSSFRRPDWTLEDYSDYVVISACHASSLSLEADFVPYYEKPPSGVKRHGVLTYYLCKVLKYMIEKAPTLINWRQVMRVVQQAIYDDRISLQVPQLEGLRDWVPFNNFARPLALHLQIAAVDPNNRYATLSGGILHGVLPGSVWSVTSSTGSTCRLDIVRLPASCLNGSEGSENDGIVAEGYLSKDFPDPASLVGCFAVCVQQSASRLPKVFVENSTVIKEKFSLDQLRRRFPLFLTEANSANDADIVIRHSDYGTNLNLPGLGNEWMTSQALAVKYAEISRASHFLHFSRRYSPSNGCSTMQNALYFALNEQEEDCIFLPDNSKPIQIDLENKSGFNWFLSLLIFRPDFSIEQRFPLEGSQQSFLRLSKTMPVKLDDGAFRDGHGNAQIMIRAIITSKASDFSSILQQKVVMSSKSPLKGTKSSPLLKPLVAHDRPAELRGFVVVDKYLILQPDSLERAIQQGLMRNERWTARFESFELFLQLRRALLISAPRSNPSYQTDSLEKEPWAIQSLSKMQSAIHSVPIDPNLKHCVVCLTCYDCRPAPYQHMSAVSGWARFHITTNATFEDPIKDLNLDDFVEFISQKKSLSKVDYFTLIVNRNSIYPIKHLLITQQEADWVKKIQKIVFLNTVHSQPEPMSYAGLLSILPHWRTIESQTQLDEWFGTIKALDESFLHLFGHLPIISINTSPTHSLFQLPNWPEIPVGKALPPNFTSKIAPEIGFFDLPYCANQSLVHRLLEKEIARTQLINTPN